MLLRPSLQTPVDINPKVRGRLTLVAEGELGSPKVSGDGKVVVWDQIVSGNDEIMRWKGGHVENLTQDPHADIFPVPSHDGSVVAWTRFSSLNLDDPTGRWEIHEWRDGQQRGVASSPTANLFDPTVSGNGRVLAWDTDGNGGMANWNIQRQRVGGPVEDVTSGQVYSANPHLDYTGRHIIWSDGRTGNAQVWTQDGHQPAHAVAPSKGSQAGPSIGRTGSTIMFSDDSSGLGQATRVKHGNVQVVAPQAQQDQWLAAESAQGRHVTWTDVDHTQSPSPMEIYLKDGDHAPVQLTNSHGGLNAYPTMSDNGRVITWMWVNPDNTEHARVYRFERD